MLDFPLGCQPFSNAKTVPSLALEIIISRAIFVTKKWILWLYFSENMTLYDQTKMTELERMQLLYKEALPTKIGTKRW